VNTTGELVDALQQALDCPAVSGRAVRQSVAAVVGDGRD
jgi:hypothetical protein